jgi:hypothetical protein
MKMNTTKLFFLISIAIILPLLSGCFTILDVDQPATVAAGANVDVFLSVRTEDTDANAHYGVIGLLVPNDWTVDLVAYSGDFGPDTCSFLHPDSMDAEPDGQVSFWTDSLEARYPSGESMMWVVYQANTPYASNLDTGYVDVEFKMMAGATGGTFNIGYFVCNAALDFTDPSYYSVSLENPIEITGGTNINDRLGSVVPDEFGLMQNYPNPFNPTTTIAFNLPIAGKTNLTVYNMLGEEVATLVNDNIQAGSHQVLFDAANLKSGIYYYRIHSGNFVAAKKFILIK